MACSGCDLNKPIQNKKYNLCSDCVFKKSHGGQSKQEVYSTRSASRPVKIYQLKTYAKPRQQRPAERVIKHKLSEVKKAIELEAIQDDKYYCWGCGKAYPGLDKSHILSVGKYKHLELDSFNINLFCRECHIDWESGVIDVILRLNSFEKDLEYIQSKDLGTYGVIINKIHHFLQWNSDKNTDLVKKAEKILKIFGETVA